MAGASVIVDDQEVIDAFKRLVDTGHNQTRALNEIGRYGKTSTQFRFRNQVGPDFRRWKPSKRAEEWGGQTLRKTGRLRNSITYNVDPKGVEWGTNVIYAAAHQFGIDEEQSVKAYFRRPPSVKVGRKRVHKTTRSGAQITYRVNAHKRHMKLPARPFLGVNDVDRSYLLEILRREMLRQAGLLT